jgi:hypothetical protein
MSRNADKQRPKRDIDTSSHAQPQGAADAPAHPQRRNPRLPHERDESARATGRHEKPARTGADIAQAGEDVERGLVDTDRRGVPNDLPTRKST